MRRQEPLGRPQTLFHGTKFRDTTERIACWIAGFNQIDVGGPSDTVNEFGTKVRMTDRSSSSRFFSFHKEVGQMVSLAVQHHPVIGGRSYNLALMPFLLFPRVGIRTCPAPLTSPSPCPAAATYGAPVG